MQKHEMDSIFELICSCLLILIFMVFMVLL
jgi:hypothetical protein